MIVELVSFFYWKKWETSGILRSLWMSLIACKYYYSICMQWKKMFSILNILHIPNALHEQCLDKWWHTPWTLTLVCYTVSPGFGVNSNIMLGLQHRNYIYKEHTASQCVNYTNPSCICRHFLHTVNVTISPSKVCQNMVLVSLNYQHLKLLSHTTYICDRLPLWITIC